MLGACGERAGRVDLGHELSTGGRSALAPMTWPWCVVRSLHPSRVTGPQPQRPHLVKVKPKGKGKEEANGKA